VLHWTAKVGFEHSPPDFTALQSLSELVSGYLTKPVWIHIIVGASVGEVVGDRVGVVVGVCVGDDVGDRVGVCVGDDVGDDVGDCVKQQVVLHCEAWNADVVHNPACLTSLQSL